MQIQADNIIILVTSITIIFLFTGLSLVLYVNLYNEKKRKHLEEKELLKRNFAHTLLQAQLEIKEQTLVQVSRELHDNLGQIASVIKINLNTLQLNDQEAASEKIADTLGLTRRLIADIKSLSVSLGNDSIIRSGLYAAIQAEAERLARTGQFRVTFNEQGVLPEFTNDTGIILFRMVQELLNNIIKHSNATSLHIRLQANENMFILVLKDNGIGFDVEEKTKSGGSGLHNLKSRAGLIGASFSITSSSQSGTEATIKLTYT